MIMRDRFIRLQTHLKEASGDLDDASAGNIAALEREADPPDPASTPRTIDRACRAAHGARPAALGRARPTSARRSPPSRRRPDPHPQGGGPGGAPEATPRRAPTVRTMYHHRIPPSTRSA